MGIFLGAVLAALSLNTSTPRTSNTSASSGMGSHHHGVWPPMQLPVDAAIDYSTDPTIVGGQVLSGVKSQMNYCASHVTHIQTRRDLTGTDTALEGAAWAPTTVKIHNARLQRDPMPILDKQGFQLVKDHDDRPIMIDFKNSKQVMEEYYPLCEDLVQKITGAAIVKAFDHNVRVSAGIGGSQQQQQGDTVLHPPVGVVHNDYTHVSAPRRLSQLADESPKANDVRQQQQQGLHSLPEPSLVEQVLQQRRRRYAFVNVWKNIQPNNTPIQQFPLAFVDATTLELHELKTFQIIYADRIGENYFATATNTTRHDWYYFPNMVPNEMLLLKQWDSHGTMALLHNNNKTPNSNTTADFTSTFSLHSSFQDPSSPLDAPPRESIEVRCVLIWDHDPKEPSSEVLEPGKNSSYNS
jgi:hypothetical protein